jgi:hypothetical protein
LLECIPEKKRSLFNDNNGLAEKLLTVPDLEESLYGEPSQGYFKEAGKSLRKFIKQEKELGKPVDELYKTLYSIGVISSLLVPFSSKLQIDGSYILEIMPGGSLLKLPFSYKDTGYEKIEFFTKSGCKMFAKLWGEPKIHKTLNEYYPKIFKFYEDRFSKTFMKSKGVLL